MITYIISHKGVDNHRNRNLLYVLEWLEKIDKISNVIVVEQDTESRINLSRSYRYKMTHIFLENNKDFFNKSWAYNVGFKNDDTDNEWIGFGDNDVIMRPEIFNSNISEGVKSSDTFSPYKSVNDLNDKDTINLIENNIFPIGEKRKAGSPFCGGIFFIKKKLFYECGGWNEGFINWGAEDDEFSNRIVKMNKLHFGDESIHLFHERSVNSTHNNKYYSNNIKEYHKSIHGGYDFNWELMGDILKYK